MKRRASFLDDQGVPAVLLEWPTLAGYQAWRAARMAWAAEHGWPGGPVELVAGQRRARRALLGQPVVIRPARRLSLGRASALFRFIEGQ